MLYHKTYFHPTSAFILNLFEYFSQIITKKVIEVHFYAVVARRREKTINCAALAVAAVSITQCVNLDICRFYCHSIFREAYSANKCRPRVSLGLEN